MGIVLASASPRRSKLLRMMGVDKFITLPAECAETIPDGLSPEETVCTIALEKAEYAAKKCKAEDTVIAADTLVYLDGLPLGKPENVSDAARMLRALSGRRHTVYTGVAILRGGERRVFAESADVFFRKLTDDEIEDYIKTGEPLDKAGAYGAQGRGAVFIERIEGDFFCVMGLPVCRLTMAMKGMNA